jgi:hypothetical protein
MIGSLKRQYSRYRLAAALLLLLPAIAAYGAAGEQVVVDFEGAVILRPDEKPVRVEQWVEKGVVFKLARQPRESKTKGLLMFFAHLSSGRKGIVCAMATEPIPVQANFPTPVSSVTVSLWGSTLTPALLEAFDSEGNVVDRTKLESIPGRKVPGDPVPIFNMTVNARRIDYIQFSGPRAGEYLAADEVRFTPVENDQKK